jgi:hypothetical protein
MSNQEVMNDCHLFSMNMNIENKWIWDIALLSSWKLSLVGLSGSHLESHKELCRDKVRGNLSFFNYHIIVVLGYLVTFTKVLTIYHSLFRLTKKVYPNWSPIQLSEVNTVTFLPLIQ